MGDDERRAEIEAMREAIIAVVHDHLEFNVAAYGKAWTGEGEDTAFIVADSAEKALAALDRVRDTRGDDEVLPVMDRDWQAKMAARSPQGEDQCPTCGYTNQPAGCANPRCPKRSPQDEDHDPTPRVTPQQAERARGMGRGGGVMGKRRPEQPPPDSPGGRPPAEPEDNDERRH